MAEPSSLSAETITLTAQPGPPLGSEEKRRRPHGRICGSLGTTEMTLEERMAQALGPDAARLSLSPERLVADWDACWLDGRPLSTLFDWQQAVRAGRLADVRGAFALAWLDSDGTLCLARDQIGHRGLYYGLTASGPLFASTLPALLASQVVERTISAPSIAAYLSYAYLPERQTLLKGVFKLLPGELVRITRENVVHSVPYFSVAVGQQENGDDELTLKTRLRSTLESAIGRMLPPANEPVGATLSGGIDSSLVVALLRKLHPGRLLTFSISFGPDYRNELPYSSLVAEHCGTEHHIIELPAKTILSHLDESIALLSDPIGDPLTTPNALAFREASRQVGIVFNGEGGDPCFGGPKNVPMLLAELLGSGGTAAMGGSVRPRNYLLAHQKCYEDLDEMLAPEVRSAISAGSLEAGIAPYFEDPRFRDFLNKLQAINVAWKGGHHILPKVDALSAPFGVLPRSPLFERDVVELAFAIPPRLKLYGTTEKYLLKEAVADVVPAAIRERPKSGMLVPVEGWFSGPLLETARERLLDGLRGYRLFSPTYLERLVSGQLGGLRPRRGVKIWLLVTLEAWLRRVLGPPNCASLSV